MVISSGVRQIVQWLLRAGVLLMLAIVVRQRVASPSHTAALPMTVPATRQSDAQPCCNVLPKRFGARSPTGTARPVKQPVHDGMAWIPPGEFEMGGDDRDGRPDERPIHRVKLDGYWIDRTLVTNAQFRRFIDATHYVTTAEVKPDWQELRKQVPPLTPKPPEDQLVAASLVFRSPGHPVALDDYSQWWQWTPGADWRHPEGPGSSIKGKDEYPVVQVSWDDAVAYANWAGKKLPTEAQFEFAARGGMARMKYFWGNDDPRDDDPHPHCNTWQGDFPNLNTARDGYERSSPVMAFPPNGYGLRDMAGNVWEWCADWYRPDTYTIEAMQGIPANPVGPDASYDPAEPYAPKRVIRGGSFLCNSAYCSSYRVAARMRSSPDSSTNHMGFRCVMPEP